MSECANEQILLTLTQTKENRVSLQEVFQYLSFVNRILILQD